MITYPQYTIHNPHYTIHNPQYTIGSKEPLRHALPVSITYYHNIIGVGGEQYRRLLTEEDFTLEELKHRVK